MAICAGTCLARQGKRFSDINDGNDVASQVDDAENMGRRGGDGENLLGNDDLGQQVDGNGVEVPAHTEEAYPYLLLPYRIHYIGGDIIVKLGQTDFPPGLRCTS